jgi:hypothetical protein
VKGHIACLQNQSHIDLEHRKQKVRNLKVPREPAVELIRYYSSNDHEVFEKDAVDEVDYATAERRSMPEHQSP